ncbi:MAG: hypothetical protein WC837_10270 [Bellilinea sp.]
MIGILAYGSLIADPGWEILEQTSNLIRSVETPFPVEYARRSKTRANAPTLVPVPFGKGDPVQAAVIVLKKEFLLQQAMDILYRREIHRIGDTRKVYYEPDSQDTQKMRIVQLHEFAEIDTVLYTKLATNFQPILDDEYNDHQKSDLLCTAACESLTEETFHTCQDGIHYLNAAIHSGVKTRLTELYAQAILNAAGHNVVDLAIARALIAKSRGL